MLKITPPKIIGKKDTLENNLIASERGWGIPAQPTLLGPNRSWDNPKIFRSKRVINPTITKAGIKEIKNNKNFKKIYLIKY